MLVLGIESSAHTFGAGISENRSIRANASRRYPIGAGGFVPSKLADFHAKAASRVISDAIMAAGASLQEIGAIGYTKGPGMGACLRIGQLCALSLAERLGVPVVPVNHALAHAEIARSMARFSDPLVLYVSGGNTQILARERHGAASIYRVYGETLDIGVGNMLDSFARSARIMPAWGSGVERASAGGSYLPLPYTVKGMEMTFTGLFTSATRLLSKGAPLRDVAFSIQHTAFAMLCEALERALMLTRRRELIACGGVAQSRMLQTMLREMCALHDTRFYVAADEYNADNGAMIALVAEMHIESGARLPARASCGIAQRFRIDTVKMAW